MELVSLTQLKKQLKKSEKWTINSIRQSLIESIEKDINRDKKRLVHLGQDGANYVSLTYANKQVIGAVIDPTKDIKVELESLKKKIGAGEADKAIEAFMNTKDFKDYKERMDKIAKKNKK